MNGEPIRLTGRYVSADHFAVFGVQPMIGRGFRRDEDQAGAAKVVLLSHAAWQLHFGGDPGVLGLDLRLDNEPHQVIGVLPPGVFDRQRGRPLEEPASFWRLNGFDEGELAASMHWLNPIGRLKPGVTLAQAQQDVLAVRARIADTIPAWKRDWTMTVEPFDRLLVGDRLRQAIYVTLGAVVLLLLIACANITSLLLAQGVSRRHEIAVRAALGAGRGRIAAQLLVETQVLGLLGGVAGVGLAALLVKVGAPLLPPIPFTAETTLDLRVLAFAALTALTVSALVGVLPALRGTAGSAAAALNTASRGVAGGHDRTRRTIVATEVAVSVVLICGAFLLTKSLLRLQQVDVGARLDHVITMSLDLSHDRYPNGAALAAFYPAVVERVRAIPGVVSAAISGDCRSRVPVARTCGCPATRSVCWSASSAPMPTTSAHWASRWSPGAGFHLTTGPARRTSQWSTRRWPASSPTASAWSIPLARPSICRPSASAAIAGASMIVVGIVGNERVRPDLRAPADAVAYVPIAQAPRMWVKLAVRTHADAAAIVPAVREAVRQIDDRLALADVRTMEQIWDRQPGRAARAGVVRRDRSPRCRRCSPPSASTASSRTPSRSGGARLASAWRSGPAPTTCSRWSPAAPWRWLASA